MVKLALRANSTTRTLNLPIDRPKDIYVESANGEEIRVQKIYHIGGRQPHIKILVDDLFEDPNDIEKLYSLEKSNKEYEEEIKSLKKEKQEAENEFDALNNELNNAENAINSFEDTTGLTTNARSLDARILELADLVAELQEKVEGLTVDKTV